MPTPALRSNYYDRRAVGVNELSAAEYNLNAQRTDTAYDNSALALGKVNGVVDVSGKVKPEALPDLALIQFKGNKTSQADMLATTPAELGDWVIRTDTGTSWVVIGSNPSQLASWQQLPLPTITWANLSGRPTVVAAGATKALARQAVDATSLIIGGVAQSEYILITDPLDASDVGAYTTAQTDAAILAALLTPIINAIKDSGGKNVVSLSSVASAANYINIQNAAAGGLPVMSAFGTDSNIGFAFNPKGSGHLIITVGTGQTPTLRASGADANHDLNLVSRGTGVVKANGVEILTTTGAQVVTGKTINGASNTISGLTSSAVTDFAEAAQDAVAAMLAGASGVTLNYNDASNTLTVTGPGDSSALAENMRDVIGLALIGAGLISVAVNDAADTITISTTATANDTDANLKNRANHTGTQAASTISDFNTAADARVSAALAAPLVTPKIANGGYIADENGNEQIVFGTTASAVNQVKVTNAATANRPTIAAVGDDANVDLNLIGQGTGAVRANGLVIATLTGAQTLTNTRLQPRVTSPAFSVAPSINVNNWDHVNLVGLSAAITSMSSGLLGTPTDGQRLRIKFKDDGTARAITWGASYVGNLLATTVATKSHIQELVYDAAIAKWAGTYVDTVGY